MDGGNCIMEIKPLISIEEHGMERVVSFFVNCSAPEESAWNLLREWATKNISDFKARRYIGCAPKGHHPNGEEHHSDEEISSHEYLAQMILFGDEGNNDMFLGADVCDGPKGLFLVGDVEMNEFNEDGSVDMGTCMEKSYGVMSEFLNNIGGYVFEISERPYFEEHIFSNEWFEGNGELAGFKLWLPIRKV